MGEMGKYEKIWEIFKLVSELNLHMAINHERDKYWELQIENFAIFKDRVHRHNRKECIVYIEASVRGIGEYNIDEVEDMYDDILTLLTNYKNVINEIKW